MNKRIANGLLGALLAGILLFAVACGTKKTEGAKTPQVYTCPMHPQIIRDQRGSCPICGMDLVKKETASEALSEVNLTTLIQPTNSTVVSSLPVTTLQHQVVQIDKEVLGSIEYDTRFFKTVAARVPGRIEKLYVKYRYQYVHAGEKLMDVYSPDLSTGQQNLLFLLKNDPDNAALISAAKQKLIFLGMSRSQVAQVIATRKTLFSVSVYSNATGHIHEAEGSGSQNPKADENSMTDALSLKEGMYVTTGQPLFQIYDQSRSWVVLNLFAGDNRLIKVGTPVTIVPETVPEKKFKAAISFIEPFYRSGSKTLTARVYFSNAALILPIGSQVKAQIHIETTEANWLPKEAVLSLGLNKVVMLKNGGSFSVHKVSTGLVSPDWVQITEGLEARDSVAKNAQFLIDSESFIKVNP